MSIVQLAMLPTNLNTNEVKGSSGTEVEFLNIGRLPNNPNSVQYAVSGEIAAYPQRLYAAHQIIGEGRKQRRRSVWGVRYVPNTTHLVDVSLQSEIKGHLVLDLPIGNLNAMTAPAQALAFLISSSASRGASETILYNCTGVGAEAVLYGVLTV